MIRYGKWLIYASCIISAVVVGADLGIFTTQGSVGQTPEGGAASYDATTGQYRITGGGDNIWAAVDGFYFIWKQMSGDMTLSADVKFVGESAAPHRKAVLMVRQGLDPGSAYADAAFHGNGLTSLQYRATAGGLTTQIPTQVDGGIGRIRIEKHGNEFTMYAGPPEQELKPFGPATVVLHDPVYVGLGVCSHVATTLETAIFSNVKIDSASSHSSR
jgi:TolB protein